MTREQQFDARLAEMDRLLIQQMVQARLQRTQPPSPQTDWGKELTGVLIVAGIGTAVALGGWKVLKLMV